MYVCMYGRWVALKGVRGIARVKLQCLNHVLLLKAGRRAVDRAKPSQSTQRRHLDDLPRKEVARWHGPGRRFGGVRD